MIFSHIGICVSDIERSKTFYAKALGFEPWGEFVAGEEIKAQHGHVADLEIHAHFLRRDGCDIELLRFVTPAPIGHAKAREMNRLGLTHLAVLVESVDAAIEAVRAFGGKVLNDTRCTYHAPDGKLRDAIFCTDPDGTRIELMHLPDAGWDEAISVGRARR